ncbi:MAG TPA: Uma2 family endonuclease [Acetobacteraceae bacterium]
MSEARVHRWTLEEFLPWEANQPGEENQPAKYELVDGQPRLMTGETQAHHLIGLNIVAVLRDRLRGSPCRPCGSDLRVITGTDNARYPDALIDCGRFDPQSHNASEPAVVFEVLSRSTGWLDMQIKLRDYDATPTIRFYVVVSQEELNVVIWTRSENGRLTLGANLTGAGETMTLYPDEARLALAEIYEGMGFGESSAP